MSDNYFLPKINQDNVFTCVGHLNHSGLFRKNQISKSSFLHLFHSCMRTLYFFVHHVPTLKPFHAYPAYASLSRN